MKKLILALLLLVTGNIYSQKSSEILPVLNVDSGTTPPNFVFVIPGTHYWGKSDVSHLVLPISQITNLQTNLDDKYPLTGNPSNFLTTITSGQVTTALGFTPLSSEIDGSITNEIQFLSILGNTISLLGVPANTANGTSVNVLVKGN